ncbi:MAG: HAD-IIIA family hydrolase [Planctomycetes bacterium]|nr:HAD-IIIA family hydrolase [Planctomycetota bacterium]MCB9888772.1 HAD-IIIA family hydrolase [Planctomycetota bacterium]
MILCGGLGTRLRSRVPDRPKALAEIGGRPFLARLLDRLVAAAVPRVVLCTGWRGEQIEQAFGERYRGLDLHYARERAPLGTAGALRAALPFVSTEHALVLNGDSEVDVALDDAFGPGPWPDASLLAVRVADGSRFGQLRVGADNRIEGFDEKGSTDGPCWINAGVYLFARDRLAELPEGVPFSLEHDVLPGWIARGLHARCVTAAFHDIGTPEAYATARAETPEQVGLLILDRDGTLIAERADLGRPESVKLLPGAAAAIRAFRARGYRIAVLTNQAGVGRGHYGEDDVAAVNQRMLELLAAEGAEVDGVWHCPHRPEDHCACRKPLPGMVEALRGEFGPLGPDLLVVGDNVCDIELGQRIGARTALVRTGHGSTAERSGSCRPDRVIDGLQELAPRSLFPVEDPA